MNGYNTKLNLKLQNGIKEMIIFNLIEIPDIEVDLRLCDNEQNAQRWFNVELKHANGIIKCIDANRKKIFVSNARDNNDLGSFFKIGYQENNLLILITQQYFFSNIDNINRLIKILGEKIEKYL